MLTCAYLVAVFAARLPLLTFARALLPAQAVAVSTQSSLASLPAMLASCRRLGLGLMTVRLKDGLVEVHADPGPYAPRKQVRKQARLLKEFARLNGDPNTGGQTRKGGLVTAYRQDALRCAAVLSAGPAKAAEVARLAQVERARAIMADNHYGWFERVERGVYGLTAAGLSAVS